LKRSFVETKLGQVHVVEAGEGPGAPLVLLHQTPRSVDEFAEVQPLLARTRRTLAVDTPGYGCSDPVPGQPSVEQYAEAVIAALDARAIERAILVGHHTGAIIAVEMAAAFPRRVERVVLSGPVYTDAAGRAELLPFFKQWRTHADGSHLKDKWDRMYGWLPNPPLTQRITLDIFRAGETSEQGHFAVAAYRMEERLPLVRCPALLLFCARDPFTSPKRAEPFRRAFHPCREVSIDAGVFAANEKPQEFADAVLAYVNGPA